ncbi:hypothetical protein ACIO1C_19890 [Streptomyces sp. NPDC087420]|uniref:hypothetical protein n=1 Tax=Streptomyces sp. NPDC087420 TaxID=3365785 RepID=UPI003835218B
MLPYRRWSDTAIQAAVLAFCGEAVVATVLWIVMPGGGPYANDDPALGVLLLAVLFPVAVVLTALVHTALLTLPVLTLGRWCAGRWARGPVWVWCAGALVLLGSGYAAVLGERGVPYGEAWLWLVGGSVPPLVAAGVYVRGVERGRIVSNGRMFGQVSLATVACAVLLGGGAAVGWP